jgi:bacteriocin-like protein
MKKKAKKNLKKINKKEMKKIKGGKQPDLPRHGAFGQAK